MSNTILIRPVLTEKSLRLAKQGYFTFQVDQDASKRNITDAINQQFAVSVVTVQTLRLPGKVRRVGKMRRETKHSDGKKAVVTLKKEQKIDLFDVGS